jgi:diguanylate cyclase (GGDEF)-like protein
MSFHWSTHQLTEYLVSVSVPDDVAGALRVGLERALESLEAEVGAVVIGGEVRASIGFGTSGCPAGFLDAVLAELPMVQIGGLGEFHLAQAAFDNRRRRLNPTSDRLVIGRLGVGCSAEEIQMLQAFTLVLGLVVHNLETLQAERSRHRLVETLLSIQRAISARHPLQELLDAITEGASSLLDGSPVTLLLVDSAAPGALIPVSTVLFDDLDEATLAIIGQAMVGGAAPVDDRSLTNDVLIADPVVVDGKVAGCLVSRVVRSYGSVADYRDLLSAFAQQVSLALTDARTLDAVREAHHDPITGLPNRTLFLQQLERERRNAMRNGQDLCVLFIDLDRFKAVNDTLGHPAGDQLLNEVGMRIKSCIRVEDIAARLGGDEFSVLLANSRVDAATAASERVIAALARAFVINGREVFIGASIGIASMTSQHQDASSMLSDADVAMYRAKRAGRGQCIVFEPYMLDDVANKLALRTDLQHAQQAGTLWLAYQPIVHLDTGEVNGAEGLMRWSHPDRGVVMPGEFIPIAEETDMIISIGTWALNEGLSQIVPMRLVTPGLGLSLNLSARQIVDRNLPAVITAALERTGFPATSLTLEITESILMDDPDLAGERLAALKALGLRLAIDDFGTGYSSLSYVRRFPVDEVKIDRSFITGLHADAVDDIAVVQSVVSLCQSLRLQTVVEGIERPDQLRILRDLGCHLGQGYLFAKPMTARDWSEFAENGTTLTAAAAASEHPPAPVRQRRSPARPGPV